MSKKLPALRSDKEAENFLGQDLSDYISAENSLRTRSNSNPSRRP